MFPGKGSQARFPGTAPQARLLGSGSQTRFPGRGSQAWVPSCSWKFCFGTNSSGERLLENLFLRALFLLGTLLGNGSWGLAWEPFLGTVQVRKQGCQERFPSQVPKNRFPGKVPKQGFQKQLPSKVPRNRFPSKVARNRFPIPRKGCKTGFQE